MPRPTSEQLRPFGERQNLLSSAPATGYRAPCMGGDVLFIVATCPWRCPNDLVLARHTLQSAGDREGAGVCGDCHPDACAGYRREYYDFQLDQCRIAEYSSRTC